MNFYVNRIFVLSIISLLGLTLAHTEERPSIHASDVVFMYSTKSPKQYDDYSGTVVGWGGLTNSRDQKSVQSFNDRVAEAQKRGMRYCGSVNFLVDFGGYIDFAPDNFKEAISLDLEGNALCVPWLWDHKHKGHPSYWFCSNNPTYQTYLLDQAERACLAPIDGLHIDDYGGSSNCSSYMGGCFCIHCMKGFREYLKQNMSKQELKDHGINNINTFDYGEFLKSKGFSADDFKHKAHTIPLRGEFQDFQNQQMKIRITQVYEHAEKIRGKALVRSVNSSASSPRTIIPSPIIDYFCGEIPQNASSKKVNADPVFIYRMVEALGDRQTATGSGQDWAWIKANDKPGLVRAWIAQTYAFGSVFMVPHRQWCYTKELGTHWYNGKPKDFADLYRFVQKNKSLFDGYKSLTKTAVICTDNDFYETKKLCIQMTTANIPHRIIYIANPSTKPDMKQLAGIDSIIVNPKTLAKAKWLNKVKAQVIAYKDIESLPESLKTDIRCKSDNNLRVSLRYNPEDDKAPVVCHLLNQNYNFETDSIIPTSATVQISKKMFNGKSIGKAVIHSPNTESRNLKITTADDVISLTVENQDTWSIIELQ